MTARKQIMDWIGGSRAHLTVRFLRGGAHLDVFEVTDESRNSITATLIRNPRGRWAITHNMIPDHDSEAHWFRFDTPQEAWEDYHS